MVIPQLRRLISAALVVSASAAVSARLTAAQGPPAATPSSSATAPASGAPSAAPAADRSRSGAELYRAGCATCHGPDGKGSPRSVVGFDVELPDFSDCKFSSPEPDQDWMATIHLGGYARAFSRRMPAFADALTDDEIGRVVDYLRGFCKDRSWPRGDLNLPRPMFTEKAFPENESVLTTIAASDSVENQFVYERRIGARSQYEVIVPFNFSQDGSGWNRGLGDVGASLKYALFDSMRTGTIVSAGGEMTFPTGKEELGVGGGATIAEGFAMASQILPHDAFLHVHGGFESPLKSDQPNEMYLRTALGKTFSQRRWGRSWSPMFELLAARELASGEETLFDAVPQMQVTLSRRQHIMVSAGVQLPINERSGRGTSFITYFLWDWFDGGLLEGWR